MWSRVFAEWRIELITFIISPIVLYAIYRIGRTAKSVFQFAFDWALWQFTRHTIKSLASRFGMRHYCRNQLASDNARFLQVPGRRGVPLDVDQVFVPLTIEYGNHTPESYKNLELLEEGNRLVVVGDPGSGKSSLVKYLFRESCRRAELAPTKSYGCRFRSSCGRSRLSPNATDKRRLSGCWASYADKLLPLRDTIWASSSTHVLRVQACCSFWTVLMRFQGMIPHSLGSTSWVTRISCDQV